MLTIQIQRPTFDLTSYIQRLEREALNTISFAALEYITTSLSIIPVYGGASHATFTALADAAGVPLSISPRARDTQAQGIATSDGGIDSNNNRYSFTYETTLPHLNVNERENANQFGFNLTNPGPYNFRSIAGSAAENVLESFAGVNPLAHISVSSSTVRINI